MQCQFFALQGISLLLKTVELVQKRVNPRLRVSGVLPCMFDGRTTLSKEVLEEIKRHFGEKVFKTRVRANVRLAEAPSFGKPVIEYAPESNGAHDLPVAGARGPRAAGGREGAGRGDAETGNGVERGNHPAGQAAPALVRVVETLKLCGPGSARPAG